MLHGLCTTPLAFFFPTGSDVTVNAMHPGVVNTDAHKYMPFRQSKFLSISFSPVAWYLMKGPKDGAQPQIYLAVATELEGVSGKYYGFVILQTSHIWKKTKLLPLYALETWEKELRNSKLQLQIGTHGFCRDCFEKQPDEKAQDDVAAKKLWDYSMKACGLLRDDETKQALSDSEEPVEAES